MTRVRKFIDGLPKEGILKSIRSAKNHLILEFYKTFLSQDGLIMKQIHGSKMFLDIASKGVSQELAVYGTREILETNLIKHELSKGMTMLDLGANIGYYTLIAASIVGAKGKVYAIEPEPNNLGLLVKNIELNDYSGIVEVYPFGFSDKDCGGKLFLSEFSNLHSMVDNSSDQFIEIETMRIDKFLESRGSVDFVRMDLEGYECEVIDGMMRTLENASHAIKLLIEVHQRHYNERNINLKTRLKKLKRLRFKPKYIVSAGNPRPEKIIEAGYRPITTIKEGKHYRGLYKDVSMDDLIEFMSYPPRIVRAILLEKTFDE